MPKTKRVYNPQISLESYKIVKRLSWFNNLPMTKTLDSLILEALELYNNNAICAACKANIIECESCPIKSGN